MCPFIVFEGLDGAGKSTLSLMLATYLDAAHFSSPPVQLLAIRDVIDKEAGLRTRFLYYLFANSYLSDEIRKIRGKRIVVCDRYIHSTVSIHTLHGLKAAPGIDKVIIAGLEFEIPDITFFIFTSDEKERLERIKNRGKRTKYDIINEDKEFRDKYIDYFRSGPENFVFIDTSHETPEESLRKIKRELFSRNLL